MTYKGLCCKRCGVPAFNVLAVYHGRQVNRPVITGCAAPLTVINPLERRVYMYPVEYRSYGPDGVNVIFERDNNGTMVKRFITTDYQGSVVLAQDAGDAHYKYTPFGEPLTQENIRRTGYLDRETDWESSPLVPELRTLNLVHRTYIPKHGTFTTPDPLWAMSVGASAYHYANHDPVNFSDPWGLDPGGQDGVISQDPPTGGSGETPMVEQPDDLERARRNARQFLIDLRSGYFRRVPRTGDLLPAAPPSSLGAVSTSAHIKGPAGQASTTKITPGTRQPFDPNAAGRMRTPARDATGVDPDSTRLVRSGGKLEFSSLLIHYVGNTGNNFYIEESSFNNLIAELSDKNKIDFDNSKPVSGIEGLFQVDVSTYNTSYENASGYITLYHNSSGIVGYSDWWNFESHAEKREWWPETKTRIGSLIPGSPFWVLYGITPPTNLITKH